MISPLSSFMPTSARLSRVASPQDSAVVGFELETARSQAEASVEPLNQSGDNVSVTEQWLNHQQKSVQGGGTGGGRGRNFYT